MKVYNFNKKWQELFTSVYINRLIKKATLNSVCIQSNNFSYQINDLIKEICCISTINLRKNKCKF